MYLTTTEIQKVRAIFCFFILQDMHENKYTVILRHNPQLLHTFATSVHELLHAIAKNVNGCARSQICTASLTSSSFANQRPRNSSLGGPQIR
jgi:hypothetical protein